jgi:isopenicillin N synthase-like dioxygenase
VLTCFKPQIPRDELFAKTTPGWQLPSWLQEHEELFKEAQRDAHAVEQIILGILEQELELEAGTFSKTHKLDAPTYSFLRILRYPPVGLEEGDMRERPRVFAHRDVVSIAMLFTWVCGLQIPKDDAEWIDSETPTEESWLWVRPEAGHILVNLGDTMPVFTNGVLKSGLHRVVTAYGQQANLDRVSVLFTGRPDWEVPMVPLASPKIPPQAAEQAAKPVETCKVWGDNVIKAYYMENVKKGRTR